MVSLCITFTVLAIASRFLLGLAVDPPRHSNGLTEVVQWDNYTLWLHDQRFFLKSGEFHTFRLPVPDLWLDIFQKMVAAGLNSVSIYVHWGLTNPAPGILDFDDWRALQPIFDAAKVAGIFVILRPGPYINAETTAGGLALWSTSLVEGAVRVNTTSWNAAYTPYIQGIIDAVKPNQVTEGGPLLLIQLDNEFGLPVPPEETNKEYDADLQDQYKGNGIVIPTTYNDPYLFANFINGTGAADIYGLDSYPNVLNCSFGTVWFPVPTNLHQYHQTNDPNRPFFLPEFQGGSDDYWGGPGYDDCVARIGPDFVDVYYKNSWAANVKMYSSYMFYGGTNWGGINYPGAYTSYDFAAAIRETRLLWEKYDETKRQSLFIRSSPQFLKTDWIGDSNSGIPGVAANTTDVFVTYIRNPDSGTGFFIARQAKANGTSTDTITFKITVPSLHGPLALPQTFDAIVLDGRQSKLLMTDYTFGARGSVLHTTAAVFFAGRIGTRDVLFLTGNADQKHETSLILMGNGTRTNDKHVQFTYSPISRDATVVTFSSQGPPGLVLVWNSDEQLVLFADPSTAATFWAPPIHSPTPASYTVPGLENFWQFGTNTTVLVGGPYLVRNATLSDSTLALHGDLNASVPLMVVGPRGLTAVTWNGERVAVREKSAGILTGRLELSPKVNEVQVPKLTGWRYADSLPEVNAGFDDGAWVIANHTSTNITTGMAFGDGRVLYGCDYGFCENNILWRGHFNATGLERGANLTINGGTAFAASAWINNVFIQTVSDLSAQGEANAFFPFPNGSVVAGEDNVLTVLQDHMGNDEEPNQKSSRGIRGFELVGGIGQFSMWKVQGKAGGYSNYPDKVRGVLNEGGLFGERAGWHLPGFDTSNWTTRDLTDGLPGGKAGVGFFVTTLDLDLPAGIDASMSFQFSDETSPYRALFFVNGWKYGKQIANIGPQTRFPVPPGILDYNGKNSIAVALWVTEDAVVHPTLDLVLNGVLEGGVGPIATNNPPWEARSMS